MSHDDTSRTEQLQVLGRLVDVPLADELGQRFTERGHELHLVGGTVRDCLLGRDKGEDLDFATSAEPEETAEIFQGWADTVWHTGAKFGTISASKDGTLIEVTTFRDEAYTPGSRHPKVVYGDNIEGDLRRRDFTVNAIAVRVPDRLVTDPFGGWEDLRARRLMTPTDPVSSFTDDPLRMLRLARFVASLGFVAAEEAIVAATSMAEQLQTISVERIAVELNKLVCGEHVSKGMDVLVGTGLAEQFLPEIPALAMQRDPAHHHKDVYAHTMAVIEGCDPADVTLRLAALFHDIGKPDTREFHSDGTVSFHNHDVVGARMTRRRMRNLKYPKEMIRDVSELVRLHLRFHGYSNNEWTDSAVRRYVNDCGTPEQLVRLNALTRADVTTTNRGKRRRFAKAMDDLEERIDVLTKQEELNAIRPALDGNQIMTILDLKPGPMVGKAWKHMKDLALEHGPLEPDEAERQLRLWAEKNGL